MKKGVLTVIAHDSNCMIIKAPQLLRYQVFKIYHPSKDTGEHGSAALDSSSVTAGVCLRGSKSQFQLVTRHGQHYLAPPMLVYLVAVKGVAKATPKVSFAIRRLRKFHLQSGKHEVRVLGWGYGGARDNSRGLYSRVSGGEGDIDGTLPLLSFVSIGYQIRMIFSLRRLT